MNEALQNIKTKFLKPKNLVIAGIIGLVLIFLSSVESDEPKTNETVFSAEEYKENLKAEIEDLVSTIIGNDDVNCLITLEGSVEYSYADTLEKTTRDKDGEKDKSADSEIKEGYIVVKTADGGEQPLLITETMPKIRGVAIVCYMGDNEAVAEKIKKSVTAALNISSKKVYICGRNRQ